MKKYSTSDRLKQIMREKNLKQVDILEKAKPYCDKYNVKLGKSDLSQYISGRNNPAQKKLAVLSMALNVDEAWLMGFEVPMERKATTSNELLDMINSLDETRQKQVLDYLEFLIAQQNKD